MSGVIPAHAGTESAPRPDLPSWRLLVVTPCRNEAEYARRSDGGGVFWVIGTAGLRRAGEHDRCSNRGEVRLPKG